MEMEYLERQELEKELIANKISLKHDTISFNVNKNINGKDYLFFEFPEEGIFLLDTEKKVIHHHTDNEKVDETKVEKIIHSLRGFYEMKTLKEMFNGGAK